MLTVSQACRTISQPRGGYVNPALFDEVFFEDNRVLNEKENVSPSLIGMTVDYLTRFSMGFRLSKAFQSSIIGACNIGDKAFKASAELGKRINGLDDDSIINACKLVTFDDAFRHSRIGGDLPPFDETNPDPSTISNIRILVNRSIEFWNQYGPITEIGFTFESPEQKGIRDTSSFDAFISGGYTYSIVNGEGDYLTKETLWDFKVSKYKPKVRDTLQVLMYWIMGQHSGQEIFKGINKIGLFNPRLNNAYILETDRIPPKVIKTIEKDIFGYSK